MKQVIGILAALVIAMVPASFASAISEKTTPERTDTTVRTEEVGPEVETDQETETTNREEVKARVGVAREEAKARSTAAKEAAEARKIEMKKDRCEAAQDRLAKIVPKLSQGVTSVKKTLDAKYERVQAIYDSGKLSVANYDELSANVETAKAEAETSMELIDPSSVTVDCTNVKLGTQLDSYRSTVKETRTSLKAYHTALVELVSSMNASDSTDEKTDDTTKTETESTTEDTTTQEEVTGEN